MSEFEKTLENIESQKPGMTFDVALELVTSIMGRRMKGLLDSTQAVELYRKLLDLLLQAESEVDSQFAVLVTIIAKDATEIELVGKEITDRCDFALTEAWNSLWEGLSTSIGSHLLRV